MEMECTTCGNAMEGHVEQRDYDALPGVVLDGVTVYRCTQCDDGAVIIPKLSELNRVIANMLVAKRAPYSGPELRFLRKFKGLSTGDTARALGVPYDQVMKWEESLDAIDGLASMKVKVLVLASEAMGGYSDPLPNKEVDISFDEGPRLVELVQDHWRLASPASVH